MTMWLAIAAIASAGYIGCAALAFISICDANGDLKRRKHYRAHPERHPVLPTWGLALLALAWPLWPMIIIAWMCRRW